MSPKIHPVKTFLEKNGQRPDFRKGFRDKEPGIRGRRRGQLLRGWRFKVRGRNVRRLEGEKVRKN